METIFEQMTINGKTYQPVAEAYPSCRLFPGCDAAEGETYWEEWVTRATDIETDDDVLIFQQFEVIKGEEIEADSFDWLNPDTVTDVVVL